MRKVMSALAAMGVSVAVATGISVGCINPAADCREINTCCPDGTMDCFATTTSSSSSSSGAGGDDGGPPPGCIPSENVEAVADTCGVFVSSSQGDDGNAGSKDKPLKTIGAALAQAKGKPVYACGELFDETVSITENAALYGALDCAKGWVYDASKKTQLAPTMDAIALSISKATTSADLYDIAISSSNATQPGGSSIAVLVAQAAASFTRCDVTAGSGAAGVAGTAQTKAMTPASAKGSDGADDAMCNVSGVIPGGAGGTNACNGTKTDGGNGGKGVPASTGDNGGGGLPMMTPGNGGAGQTVTASCKPGQPGLDGNVLGTPMPGTGARGIGDVSAAGYQAPTPAPGGNGFPGQGGGGGGAALACDSPTNNFSGPSGGGGGAGGCGGAPGNLGQSGGSSIGILALSATLTLTNVTITSKDGGAGGLGGDGQRGGNGGLQGNAIAAGACPGGPGGQGGAGGPGGGGAGGHSVSIAIKGGKLPNLDGVTLQHGNGASGGAGGDMDMTAQTKGDDGLGCKSLDFTDPQSPSACVK